MNAQIPRTRTPRDPGFPPAGPALHAIRSAVFSAAVFTGIVLSAPGPSGAAVQAAETFRLPATTELSVPQAPGLRVPGLRYFRLEPTARDTVYRLVVIPVRFPEDRILGGGSREAILAKLGGATASLARYYLDQTGERLRIECTLAPTVIARHDRDYYTVDGGGYGNDPDAYPNNAQRLVEEVTAALDTEIDFRVFDNTRDGITDGLLVLHSGPRSVESGVRFEPDVLLAHAFTVAAPIPRGGGTVFPYAVAATRDGVGIWAHEVGHLLGLADLYVASGICPGPGVGEWSLMATGSNREDGENPTGLDAFSRQLLGLVPEFDPESPVDLGSGAFLRASEPGQERGPRYYLVEKREAGDGPAGQTPARVVYFVDEEAGDNRSCPLPGDVYRPMVRVAGVLCPGASACTSTFQESCPPLGDIPRCFPVNFLFGGDAVSVVYEVRPPVLVDRVGLSVPRGSAGMQEQRIYLTLHNASRVNSQSVSLTVVDVLGDSICVLGPTTWGRVLAPAETATDSSLTLVPCTFLGDLPREEVRVVLQITSVISSSTRVDTLSLPAGEPGLLAEDWEQFSIRNLEPDRRVPWESVDLPDPGPCDPDCPPGQRIYTVQEPDRLAHGELVSPWFLVPENGHLVVQHTWSLDALSADIALDAGQIRLRSFGRADRFLTPPGGWGFTAERSVGNALAGLEVLSGSGSRIHAFDLSAFSGQVVRVVCVAAGDADPGPGEWTLDALRVLSGPPVEFTIEEHPDTPGALLARAIGLPVPGIELMLFRGRPATHPVTLASALSWDGSPLVELGPYEGPQSRFELVWIDSSGAASATGRGFALPVVRGPRFLMPPSPNPLRPGESQTWMLRIGDSDPRGMYRLRVLSLAGGVVWSGTVRIDVPGTRLLLWDGRDEEGRAIPKGVYFLEVRSPGGAVEGARIVVLR